MKKYLTLKNLGWVLTAFVALMMTMSGVQKVMGTEEMVTNFTYMKLLPYLSLVGVMELLGVGFLIFNRTSIYGAALIGSLMSAAVVMHLAIIGSGAMMPVIIGVSAWLAYFLREKIS